MQNHFQFDVGRPVFHEKMIMGIYMMGRIINSGIEVIYMGNLANEPIIQNALDASSSHRQD